MTWILIMTLLSGHHTVATIDGFETKEACEQAGTVWRKVLQNENKWLTPLLVCVHK